jgi:hypothetical protein
MVSSKGIASVIGWRALITQLYISILPNIKHRWRWVVEELSDEGCEQGGHQTQEDSSWEKKISHLW